MAQTYAFKVLTPFEANSVSFEEGEIFEVSLSPHEYDAFKARYPIERYFLEPIPMTYGQEARLDGKGAEIMKRIRDQYPGAKKMFSNAAFQPTREF